MLFVVAVLFSVPSAWSWRVMGQWCSSVRPRTVRYCIKLEVDTKSCRPYLA